MGRWLMRVWVVGSVAVVWVWGWWGVALSGAALMLYGAGVALWEALGEWGEAYGELMEASRKVALRLLALAVCIAVLAGILAQKI